MMSTARLRRLQNDYDRITRLEQQSGMVYVAATEGSPADRYAIVFRCRGISAIDDNDQPILIDHHRVELILPPEYPRLRPLMRWMTPIFHPNFDDSGNICIEDWYPQRTLADLCVGLVEMVQYKIYNTTSPLNMNASMWAMRNRAELPVDKRSLRTSLAKLVVTDTIPIRLPTT